MSEIASSDSKTRLLEYDLLRASCVIYIVGLWHLIEYTPRPLLLSSSTCMKITQCVLAIFVFISGYFLSARSRIASTNDLLQFLERRFFRIYPMYLITLLSFAFIGLIDKTTTLKSIFLIDMLWYGQLPTLWFVNMIVLFYFIFPILVWHYRLDRCLLIGLIISSLLFLAIKFAKSIDIRLFYYFPSFLTGVILAKEPRILERLTELRSLIVEFVLLVILVGVGAQRSLFVSMLLLILTTLVAQPLGIVAGRYLAAVIPSRYYRWLAYAGFAVYLVHRIVFELGTRVYRPRGLLDSIFYLYMVLLPLTFGVGYLFQASFDRLASRTSGMAFRSGSTHGKVNLPGKSGV